MAAKEIKFTPSWRVSTLQRWINYANSELKKLQSFVAEHGEGWEDVLQYVAKGADHKKQARLKEVRAWMDANKTPSYVRGTMEAEALKDLGAANLQYWEELVSRLRVRTDNYGGAPAINLAKDVDASGEVWRVSDKWIKAQEADSVVTFPEWMVADLEQFKKAAAIVADLGGKGYSPDTLAKYMEQMAYADSPTSDNIDPETWFSTYVGEDDKRVMQPEK